MGSSRSLRYSEPATRRSSFPDASSPSARRSSRCMFGVWGACRYPAGWHESAQAWRLCNRGRVAVVRVWGLLAVGAGGATRDTRARSLGAAQLVARFDCIARGSFKIVVDGQPTSAVRPSLGSVHFDLVIGREPADAKIFPRLAKRGVVGSAKSEIPGAESDQFPAVAAVFFRVRAVRSMPSPERLDTPRSLRVRAFFPPDPMEKRTRCSFQKAMRCEGRSRDSERSFPSRSY